MAAEDESKERSPFSRVSFIASAALVLLLVAATVFLVTNPGKKSAAPSPTSDPSTPSSTQEAPASEGSSQAPSASRCGLEGLAASGTVSKAPPTRWEYQGAIAYPTSAKFGPAQNTATGVRYCFQHSPEGALFAAGNAVAQGSDVKTSEEWIKDFLSKDVKSLKGYLNNDGSMSGESTRLSVVGFRMLSYSGDKARVDMAVQGKSSGQLVYASAIYSLTWEDGDWKLLPDNPENPLQLAQITDTQGYIPWKG